MTSQIQVGDYVRKDGQIVRVESIGSNGEVFTSDGGVVGVDELTDADIMLPSEIETGSQIKGGDYVRSFDFSRRDLDGPRACYVEGTVSGFTQMEGCERYVIDVARQVFAGQEIDQDKRPRQVFPPLNGTPRLFHFDGPVCNGVVKVTD